MNDLGQRIAVDTAAADSVGDSQERGGDARPSWLSGMIGESEAFQRLVRRLPRLALSDATVLITGETGTGKELAAHAIHAQSQRRDAPFIPVNCGALPEDLMENELFGHAKGAYTGAAGAGKGLLAEAEGGTLFLDELNSLSLSSQAKLLRFLQNREYRVLGSARLLHANVRIVAASNIDLGRQISLGAFRADLYHRLHVLSVEMPPLRARREDIPLLAAHFAAIYGAMYGRVGVRFSDEAMEILMNYNWPGNIRELQSFVERAVLLTQGAVLCREDLDEIPRLDSGGAFRERSEAIEAAPALGQPLEGRAISGEAFRVAKERTVRQFERCYLVDVMATVGGNVSRGARLAGMQRRDFQRLLRKHGVHRAEPGNQAAD